MEMHLPENTPQTFQPESLQPGFIAIETAGPHNDEVIDPASGTPPENQDVSAGIPVEEIDYSETFDRLEEIYRERREGMVRFVIRKKFASREDAEDAVQEAFAQVLRFPHGISQRSRGNQPSYMYTAAMHADTDRWRKERRTTPFDPMESTLSDDLKERVAYDEFGEINFGLKSVTASLELAVRLMPSREQFIVKRLTEGLNNEEIADALGINPETAAEYIRRIRRALRAVAKKEGWHK